MPMVISIPAVLDAAALTTVRTALEGAQWEDGKATAGLAARQVKNNLQLPSTSDAYKRLAPLILEALVGNELVQAVAMPLAIRPLLISRYRTGMSYGWHVDNAVIGQPPIRSDLSFTLFLSNPGDYEGGELVLEQAGGEQRCKLEAGSAVLYYSTLQHRVDPVRSGERTVAVGWMQSLCSDARVREALFDLYRVLRALYGQEGKSEQFNLVGKIHANLLRAFASP